MHQIVAVLVKGLHILRGRALIEVFKAISILFEHEFSDTVLSKEQFDMLVAALNQKWEHNQQKDSVVCPILECLITAS